MKNQTLATTFNENGRQKLKLQEDFYLLYKII